MLTSMLSGRPKSFGSGLGAAVWRRNATHRPAAATRARRSLLLLSVLTGSDLLGRLTHFESYTTVMFCTSVLFSIFSALQFARDARRHFKSEAARDWRLVLRYSWNAVFWLG